MKFTFAGTTYRISFQHQTTGGTRYTYCKLWREIPTELVTATNDLPTKPSYELVLEEDAYCHTNDNFCRAIGRKLSLARALYIASPDKEFRRAAWMAYLHRADSQPTTCQ